VKIIIACSNKWCQDKKFLNQINNLEVTLISTKKQLNSRKLDNVSPRFIFFPHWNWKVPKTIYEKYECIAFHTAPLPYGRGGSPIQNLILNGFKSAPVCAF